MGDSFTTWRKPSMEVRLLPSHRHWEIEALSSLINYYISIGWFLGPGERVLGYKTGKSLSWERLTSQSCGKSIYNWKFSTVNALRKVRSDAYTLDETCLRFSQARGITATILCSFSFFLSHRTVHKTWMNGEPLPPPSQWMF